MVALIGQAIGNYVVQKEVGRGGMGVVYLAEHPRLRRRVAVKVLHADMSRDPAIVARFFNEARAASDIRDAHIVEVLDFGELPGGPPYLVMEWLEGRSLGALLDKEARIGLSRAARLVAGAGRALAAAHAHGVVHRDLKPDNIFLVRRDDDPEFVKVLDFGIAKLLAPGDGPSPRTATNVVLGTPAYMSPEQCRGESSGLDGRSDIYSLGVILYELVTGRRPFVSETYTGVLVAHITQAPPPPRQLDPTLPEAVERVILRALEKDREQRYARVDDMIRELAAASGVAGSASTSPMMSAPPTLLSPPVAVLAPRAPGPPASTTGRPASAAGTAPPATSAPASLIGPPAPTIGHFPPPVAVRAHDGAGAGAAAEVRHPASGAHRPARLPSQPSLARQRPAAASRRAPAWQYAVLGAGLLAFALVIVVAVRRGGQRAPSPPSAQASPPLAASPPIGAPSPPRTATATATATARPAGVGAAAAVLPEGLEGAEPRATDPPRPPPAGPPPAREGGRSSTSHHGAARTHAAAPTAARPAASSAAVLDPYAEPAAAPHGSAAPALRTFNEPPADDLDRRLSAAASGLVPAGRRHGPTLRGAGDEGEGQDRYVGLEADHCYTFVSVGSPTMPQLYTYLWDPKGSRIADHRSSTAVSHFDICAPQTGQYHFQAKPAHGPGQFRTAIYQTR